MSGPGDGDVSFFLGKGGAAGILPPFPPFHGSGPQHPWRLPESGRHCCLRALGRSDRGRRSCTELNRLPGAAPDGGTQSGAHTGPFSAALTPTRAGDGERHAEETPRRSGSRRNESSPCLPSPEKCCRNVRPSGSHTQTAPALRHQEMKAGEEERWREAFGRRRRGARRGHRPHQHSARELFHIYALAAGHTTMSCAIYNSPCLE